MPELPEVENTRRFLAPVVEGRRLVRVEVRRDRTGRRNARPSDVVERLTGRRVERLGRRGKFLVAAVQGDLTWVTHLGMSGRVRIVRPGEPEDPHTNFVAETEAGDEIRLVDPRTFGFVAVFTPDEPSGLERLGPDARDSLPPARDLGAALAGRSAPIKALLLDQRLVAGLGNIYADEVLFRARVRPSRPGGSLTPAEVRRLHEAIPAVLEEGILHGGTSLDDLAYLLPDGQAGGFLERIAVYGRTGEPCPRCGRPVERIVVAQRSAHFCRRCQR